MFCESSLKTQFPFLSTLFVQPEEKRERKTQAITYPVLLETFGKIVLNTVKKKKKKNDTKLKRKEKSFSNTYNYQSTARNAVSKLASDKTQQV